MSKAQIEGGQFPISRVRYSPVVPDPNEGRSVSTLTVLRKLE